MEHTQIQNTEDVLNKRTIGFKLRNYRSKLGLSQKAIAEAASISVSMLSQIERDLVNPSINTLKMIAKALEVPLFAFFIGDDLKDDPIIRKGEHKILGFQGAKDVIYELLTPDTKGTIEFCMMRIPPHSETVKYSQNHKTEEVAYIVKGEIVISLDNSVYTLKEGDSVRIEALSFHKWINNSDDWVSIIFAISPPSF